MTAPEKALEVEIAKLGERYRAQWLFPHLRHIADFVLLDRRVIVEVDGDSHLALEQVYKDHIHTIALEKMGYAVVRVSNADALKSPREVVESLYFLSASRPSLLELEESLASLPPLPPKAPRKSKTTRRSRRAQERALG